MLRYLALTPLLALLLGLACEGEGEQEMLVEECTPSRTMSQPCCPELEIDACGAGLVCAALDGRTQATCYAEASRQDGSQCTDDLLCASRSCNPMSNRCRASPGAVCQVDVGCGEDPMGYTRECIEATGKLTCEKVDLPPDSPCTFDRECQSNDCYCGVGPCFCND